MGAGSKGQAVVASSTHLSLLRPLRLWLRPMLITSMPRCVIQVPPAPAWSMRMRFCSQGGWHSSPFLRQCHKQLRRFQKHHRKYRVVAGLADLSWQRAPDVEPFGCRADRALCDSTQGQNHLARQAGPPFARHTRERSWLHGYVAQKARGDRGRSEVRAPAEQGLSTRPRACCVGWVGCREGRHSYDDGREQEVVTGRTIDDAVW
jgi:hypothetical protein